MSQELRPMELLKAELPQLQAIMGLNAVEGTDVSTLALQELEYLRMHALSKPEIMECIPSTVVMAMKRVLKQNLTMDPYAGLVYVKTRNQKFKNAAGQDEWKKVLEITETCNGLLSVAYQCGKIKDHKIPTVKKDESGKVESVTFEFMMASGRWEARTFDDSDFYRWRRASHKENGRNKQDANMEALNHANDNYTNWKGGIDPEFARAKAIRHALKKLGTNPNEGKFSTIVIPAEKKIVIESAKEEAAASEEQEYTPHEEVESTTKEKAVQPNVNFNTGDL
jgi:hypothetical protein